MSKAIRSIFYDILIVAWVSGNARQGRSVINFMLYWSYIGRMVYAFVWYNLLHPIQFAPTRFEAAFIFLFGFL